MDRVDWNKNCHLIYVDVHGACPWPVSHFIRFEYNPPDQGRLVIKQHEYQQCLIEHQCTLLMICDYDYLNHVE